MKAACSGPVGKGITIVIEVKENSIPRCAIRRRWTEKQRSRSAWSATKKSVSGQQIRIMPDVHAGKGLYHRDDHDHYG